MTNRATGTRDQFKDHLLNLIKDRWRDNPSSPWVIPTDLADEVGKSLGYVRQIVNELYDEGLILRTRQLAPGESPQKTAYVWAYDPTEGKPQ